MTTSSQHRLMNRSTALLTIGLSAAAASAPMVVRSQSLQKISIASSITEDLTPIMYAIKNGDFARAGLDVEVVSVRGGSVAMPAVVSGTYQIARVNLLSICSAHERNIPIVLIAPQSLYTPRTHEALLQIPVDSTSKTGAELNNKVVAVVSLNDIDTLAAKTWVDKNGGDSKTLKFVEVPTSAMEAAIVQHRVEAAVMEPPYLESSIAAGTSKTLGDPMGAIANNYMIAGYIARSDWASQNADTVRKFGRVWAQAATYVGSHASETAPLVAEFTKTDLAVVQKMNRATYGTALEPGSVQPLIDAAAKYGMIDRTFPARELFWSGAGTR